MGSEWPTTTLGDEVDLLTGFPFKSADYTDAQTGTKLVRGDNVVQGHLRWDGVKRWPAESLDGLADYELEAGDVVLAMDRPWIEAGLKYSEITKHDLPALLVQRVSRLRGKERLHTRFLKYLIGSPYFTGHVLAVQTGTAVPHISGRQIKEFEFRLPPLPEQKAIAHILGTLDDKIELNRRMNATLEGMAQALFKSWFVDFDPVIDNALAAGNPIPDELAPRAEVRKNALANASTQQGSANRPTLSDKKPLFPAAFEFIEEFGWFPEGWDVRPLAEEVQLTMGQSPSSDHYNTEGVGLPFHQGVTNYGTRFPKHEQFSTGGNRYAENGDVLFSVRAPVGRINLADRKLIIGRGLAALRHKKNYQGFLIYFLKQTFATEDSIGSGTIFNAVNKKEMERIPFIVPPDATSRAFDDFVNSLDEKIASNAEQTETLTKLRDTLLPRLISGELRLSEAEPITEEAIA